MKGVDDMEYIKVWIVLWVIAAYISACIFVPGAAGKMLCFYVGAICGGWIITNSRPRMTREDFLRKLRFK